MDPEDAEWHTLYCHGDDGALVNTTSLTRTAFDQLLEEFSKDYLRGVKNQTRKGGRPSKMQSPSTILGFLLTWYCDQMGAKTVCRMFGIPPSTCGRYLRIAEVALLGTLRRLPEGKFLWPTKAQQVAWGALVELKHPYVTKRWGFIDGKNYRVAAPGAADLQNAMYNGWLHSVYITGCACFGVDGCVIWAKHNVVGSWNDGENSRPFQLKLQDEAINEVGHGVLSDSAFPVSGDMFTLIISPLKEGDIERSPAATRPALFAMSAAITTMRQSAEWGMGAVEKVYRRLLNKLPFNAHVRADRLEVLHRLYNFRVRTTGISQIRSYFHQ